MCFNGLRCAVRSGITVAALLVIAVAIRPVYAAQISVGQLTFQIDRGTGVYSLQSQNPAMMFQGTVGAAVSMVKTSSGHDRIGVYQRIAFQWRQKKNVVLRASVRLYAHKPVALFAMRFLQATEHPQFAFPDFSSVPKAMHVFSYGNHYFAPPQFRAGQSDTPWLLFDDHLNAAIISPASHFLITTMRGDGMQRIAVRLHAGIAAVPMGFRISSLMVITHGINLAWDMWGHALTDLTGKIRPSNEADWALRYLGYWTSNGCGYFLHFNPNLGYADTLLDEIRYLHLRNIPTHYLQLDGWWGSADSGVNRTYFPRGLRAFQKQVGIPLFTYGVLYGNNVRGKQYQQQWNTWTAYLKSRGAVAYETDWLNAIYKQQHLDSHLHRGNRFFNSMANSMAAFHLSLMYCMAKPCEFLQSAQYSNVTTSRVSNDFFIQPRWRHFIFTSRLADAVGMWPWADACLSTSRYGILLQTLSAGMVGFGDLRGHENRAHIMPAVRSDGVIVKPDVPLVPTGQSYLNQIAHPRRPIIARTYTQQHGVRTVYVFAFDGADMAHIPQRLKGKPGPVADGNIPSVGYSQYFVPITRYSKTIANYHRTVKFSPSQMGLHGVVFVYNYFTHQAVMVPADGVFTGRLGKQRASFYECAASGPSGIAFLGDLHQYVGTGKARIPYLANTTGGLMATVAFAKGERAITLGGYAGFKPVVKMRGGTAGAVQYVSTTGAWRVTITAAAGAKSTRLDGQPVQEVSVQLSRP
ncbi:MAG: hypothetical protein ACP5I8_11020 [Phycisphaerae bacterium]